ncbi:cytochrome c oxidase subunit 3 family protein [Thiothrix unzii]|uniref:Cytochrome c oxidase subunit 3 family protein n=1 Tax=Thiothrix unzii TaxID=111769 RepID=A0A975FBF0_9GAMM|nr:cytochrome c oxidase subunit 3 family protein [Thiothrix unzii]QTR54737.1 cytochrome c oxidase subunit 3 family protein [Thiothrix unzii]
MSLLNTPSVSSSPPRPVPLPGDLAMWFFILAELLVFAVFFASYAFARSSNVELFNHYQQTLNRDIGAANTVILLTGSLFVVLAVQAVKAGNSVLCRNWLLAGATSGAVFLLLKGVEFADKFAHGISLSTNTFYMFYLSLTFFHFMHVIMGMIILGAVAWKAHTGDYSATQHTGVETGASYWHMVDLVWIVLFPLVYVMR